MGAVPFLPSGRLGSRGHRTNRSDFLPLKVGRPILQSGDIWYHLRSPYFSKLPILRIFDFSQEIWGIEVHCPAGKRPFLAQMEFRDGH